MKLRAHKEIKLAGRTIGRDHPTYFIADIAANHDGDLSRATDLIHLAAEAGAQAAKFQHFSARTIVSDHGFRNMGAKSSHQANWTKSVFEVYEDASLNPDWTPVLAETCKSAGITFFTSPYSFEWVDAVDSYVPAYKVGSGDITWIEIIRHMASKGKPVLLATGASTAEEVNVAVEAVLEINPQLVLMQCNTNYTGNRDNFAFINLNVLHTYRSMYPDLILGLSDHTPGHTTVLGAVALGARVVEKHFTDDNSREGPDHPFSMVPHTWREMVERTRELESALGSGVKRVEENEVQTVVVQRRAIRAGRYLPDGTVLSQDDLVCLRPCPADALPPTMIERLEGRILNRDIVEGEHIQWTDLS